MPEYLAPGVFVEETSFRQKTIEGVSTSTTGFVGPTRFGPTEGEPELLTSFADFERIYGGLDGLNYTDQRINYLAHGVRAYFEEGGKRLYVVRLFQPGSDSGVASWQSPDSPPSFELRARYPGAAGNLRVTLLFKREGNVRNVVGGSPGTPILSGVRDQQVVLAASGSPEVVSLYQVESVVEASGRRFRLRDAGGAVELDAVAAVYPLTVTVTVAGNGRFDQEQVWDELSFDPSHPRSLNTLFAAQPERRATALFVPLVFDPLGLSDGMAIATALLDLTNSEGDTLLSALADPGSSDTQRSFQTALSGGNDGGPPLPIHYQGQEIGGVKTGLVAFEDLEDISIVAAPGSTLDASDGDAVMRFLIGHCERMRYRVAVLDSVLGYLPGQMRDLRGGLDSTRAALYYPWVRVTNPLAADPLAPSEILLPPSGFMAGIYARNDVERGVHKAPANEVIRLALGFELLINKAQQEVLNPLGINCLR
ncbi:MAG: phage tail sheath subtilisin-like domain-containing protein, partial [Candidatus Competibacteraceae bacterium]|nr:phage tail sheath subtilisin-like domain-containing protein [Candidatus Competibacteraceae bacterium]